MTFLLVLLLLSAATLTAWRVLVPRDGYGVNPPPRGTRDWTAGDLPSRPYGS